MATDGDDKWTVLPEEGDTALTDDSGAALLDESGVSLFGFPVNVWDVVTRPLDK